MYHMLKLRRQLGQKTLIGDNISVTVLEIKGSNILLGFDAPSDVKVLREELPYHQDKVKEQKPQMSTKKDGRVLSLN